MNVLDIVKRAQACCARVPDRNIIERTRQAYEKEFSQMWAEDNLDPLRPRMARDTYNFRRAALLTGGRLFLEARIADCMAAGDRRDAVAAHRSARELFRALEKIEKAFDLEPPLPAGVSPFELPPSRFRQAETADRKRGLNSKKHDLGNLPEGWDIILWDTATSEAYESWPWREALAVHMLAGVRPEELVPGMRPAGWSPGVLVELRSEKCLAITFMPSKSHRGLFGTGITTICIDPTIASRPAAFLAARCRLSANHRIVVSIASKDAVRKAINRLGGDAFGELTVSIAANTIRHQVLADLKVTFGAGEIVATAAGHSTERTQARYGAVQHGRVLVGYISITGLRPPRCGNVERARQLGQRRPRRKKKQE
ncbi:hypothetical protein QIH77_02150 [Bradyrhizobium diazoefficiens]|uniref:hypothetical protein n=1 Tax=Bradyrhizobium diazoefficiens TaxID=1355477 RepID=UPI002729E997|nr:hypothetical protein [Bradyrhizobium diazoefficiens]WLA74061.1 hypothetical protein QIH77_02150 [Bradyrhizobium diazoefficiens]